MKSDVLLESKEIVRDAKLCMATIKRIRERMKRIRDLEQRGYSIVDLRRGVVMEIADDAIACGEWAVDLIEDMRKKLISLNRTLGNRTKREHWG